MISTQELDNFCCHERRTSFSYWNLDTYRDHLIGLGRFQGHSCEILFSRTDANSFRKDVHPDHGLQRWDIVYQWHFFVCKQLRDLTQNQTRNFSAFLKDKKLNKNNSSQQNNVVFASQTQTNLSDNSTKYPQSIHTFLALFFNLLTI